jgi:hypothetical protein
MTYHIFFCFHHIRELVRLFIPETYENAFYLEREIQNTITTASVFTVNFRPMI